MTLRNSGQAVAKTAAALARQLGEDMVLFIHSPSYTDEDFLKQIVAIGENLITLRDAERGAALVRAVRIQTIGEMRKKFNEAGLSGHYNVIQELSQQTDEWSYSPELAAAVREQCAQAAEKERDDFEAGSSEYCASQAIVNAIRALSLPHADAVADHDAALAQAVREQLRPLREELDALLCDEDLNDDKLREAAENLLPRLADAIRKLGVAADRRDNSTN